MLHVSFTADASAHLLVCVQPANSLMNGQRPNIGSIQIVHVLPGDCPALARSVGDLWAPRPCQHIEDLLLFLLTYSGISPFRAITPRIFIFPCPACRNSSCMPPIAHWAEGDPVIGVHLGRNPSLPLDSFLEFRDRLAYYPQAVHDAVQPAKITSPVRPQANEHE